MRITEKRDNSQLVINMIASLVTFVVGLGIKFFLTPFVVRTLGADAYGFIGLSSNILSYTGLITVALNSMAGRFITIKYIEGNIEDANKYYASVFYSNLVMAVIILFFGVGCVIWLEYIIDIPTHLVFDVKFLFSLLVLNNIIGLITSIWGVATFIKNRLDLSNIRGIIGNLLNATILVVTFSCFTPHIWYIGIAGMVLTFYCAITNRRYTEILTPELTLGRRYYDWSKVVELLKSGVWNVISKLANMFEQEFDLLFANIFIGATAMGLFSMTKSIPFLILVFFQTVSGVFAPVLTQLYAKNNKEQLINELNKTIRILGFFTTIPLACLYLYGDFFYKLWLPTEDCKLLQLLTVLATSEMMFSMPLEALWNIFTITNKLKYSTLTMLGNSIITFSTVLIGMCYITDVDTKLILLASARTFWGIVRSLTFLPMYGAYCLNISILSFYPPVVKSCICMILCMILCLPLRDLYYVDSWLKLCVICIITCLIVCIVGMVVVVKKTDRIYLYDMFIRIFKK